MDTNQIASQPTDASNSDWMETYEGQLAVDVYQTPDDIVVRAPIAGVKPEDLEISITDDIVSIKGERKNAVPTCRLFLNIFPTLGCDRNDLRSPVCCSR